MKLKFAEFTFQMDRFDARVGFDGDRIWVMRNHPEGLGDGVWTQLMNIENPTRLTARETDSIDGREYSPTKSEARRIALIALDASQRGQVMAEYEMSQNRSLIAPET